MADRGRRLRPRAAGDRALGHGDGALFTNPQAVGGLGFLGSGVLAAISGIFFPLANLWGWVQGLAQVLPVYWIGLGMRSAFLPDEAAAVEVGGTWRTGTMLLVLATWAVVGLALVPRLLRRMAQHESGSSVAERREKALQRGY